MKQLKESREEETAKSEVVLELKGHLNDANEEVTELKQMLEEAGEAFTEKEAEISKLRAALDDEEACIRKQVRLEIKKPFQSRGWGQGVLHFPLPEPCTSGFRSFGCGSLCFFYCKILRNVVYQQTNH